MRENDAVAVQVLDEDAGDACPFGRNCALVEVGVACSWRAAIQGSIVNNVPGADVAGVFEGV